MSIWNVECVYIVLPVKGRIVRLSECVGEGDM